MSATTYTPGAGNSPFGNANANPQSSQYGAESIYSAQETILLEKAVQKVIFDAAPQRYDALKILNMKGFEEENNDEFEYLENTFNRTALQSAAVTGAQAAVPGAAQTQVLTLTAASMSHVSVDLIIAYPNNSKAIIRSINAGANQITVESLSSAGLPAVANGEFFAIHSSIQADGMDNFKNYERLQTITRYNYIQMFARAQRWARVELQKHINSGRTNYLDKDKNLKIEQLRLDMFNCYFNGTRGEFRTADGIPAKAMGGLFPTMVAAGSLSGNPTLAGFQTVFENLAFQTNYKKEGGTRMVYGTAEMLHELYKIYVQSAVRYAPNDTIARMELTKIVFGGMNFVLVPCELFREDSCFPSEWRRKLLIIDQETVTPVKMKGIPSFEMGQTLNRRDNGTRENFTDFWVQGMMSQRFHNPPGSFYIDIQ